MVQRFILITIILLLGSSIVIAEDEARHVTIPDVIYGNEPELANNVLITIDDCLSEEMTRKLFYFLREHDFRAVFFPLTSGIRNHDPQLWQEIVAAGFEIGYHTRNHQPGLNQAELAEDFTAFQAEIRTILDDPDYVIRYVRPPFGIWDANWLAWSAANDLHTVRWNIVPRFDLQMPYVRAVMGNRNFGGTIFLLHSRPTDYWWLERNIDELLSLRTPSSDPYRFTTLTEAFND
jgi:peptidoglycan/xylan/chitin deacetylase (PgdA/CDA1 family)